MNEQELREQIAEELERQSFIFMKSDEYSLHDTALRSKTLLLAAEIVRGTFNG